MVSIAHKICVKCGELKDLQDFYSRKRKNGSLRYDCACKYCRISDKCIWQKENPDIVNRQASIRYRKNPDKYKNKSSSWYKAHPQIRLQVNRNYAKKHPLSPEANAVYCGRRRAKVKQNGGNLSIDEWDTLLRFYNYTCLCCGRDDVKLTLDHVVPISMGGKHDISNVQPLCKSCNSSKGAKVIDYRR